MSIADDLSKKAEAIISAQLEECVRQLTQITNSLTPAEAAEAFSLNFGKRLISLEFIEFCKRLKSAGLRGESFLQTRPSSCTVAHVFNINTTSAIRQLCRNTTPVTKSFTDLRSCCEDVASGRSDYCIMPTASTDGGLFPSFRKLTAAYDLKVCAETTVICSDREAEMRFVLLGRSIELSSDAKFVEFSFLPDAGELACILSAFSDAGCTVSAVNTYPTEFSIDKCECSVTLNVGELGAPTVIYFLEAALPGHILLGVY